MMLLFALPFLLINVTILCAEKSNTFFENHKSDLDNTEELQAHLYLKKIQPLIAQNHWQQYLGDVSVAKQVIEYIAKNVICRSHNVIPALLLNTPATDKLVSTYLEQEREAAHSALMATLEEICRIKKTTNENIIMVNRIISMGVIPTEKIKRQTKNKNLIVLLNLDEKGAYHLLTQVT
jgi:hypothetical protein